MRLGLLVAVAIGSTVSAVPLPPGGLGEGRGRGRVVVEQLQGGIGGAKDHLVFFVIADWGIGGYDGAQASSGNRRLDGDAQEEGEDEEERDLKDNNNKQKSYYEHKTAASMATATGTYGTPDAILALGDK